MERRRHRIISVIRCRYSTDVGFPTKSRTSASGAVMSGGDVIQAMMIHDYDCETSADKNIMQFGGPWKRAPNSGLKTLVRAAIARSSTAAGRNHIYVCVYCV